MLRCSVLEFRNLHKVPANIDTWRFSANRFPAESCGLHHGDLMNVETLISVLLTEFTAKSFVRATFSGRCHGPNADDWQSLTLRPVMLDNERVVQVIYSGERKTLTKNFTVETIPAALQSIVESRWSNAHVETTEATLDIRTSKKGKVHVSRAKQKTEIAPVPLNHNLPKDVPFPELLPNRLLELLGVMTANGQVKPTMRGKFTQVNEFLKHLRHSVESAAMDDVPKPWQILDAGCGSSFLTFAVQHDLTKNLGIDAEIVGVDLNDEVIRKSARKAEQMNLDRLSFRSEKISVQHARADIVLALHACDTATDDALALAVQSGARIILSVPCCHHHMNAQLKVQEASEVLRPLLRHGLLHERTADNLTDAFRALALRILGYSTDVVEFVGTEHTPRNLLLRAVKKNQQDTERFVREYQKLKAFFGVVPYLETVLPQLKELVAG
jgi:SAM-dependent methyltransferase